MGRGCGNCKFLYMCQDDKYAFVGSCPSGCYDIDEKFGSNGYIVENIFGLDEEESEFVFLCDEDIL